jgi:hypothetical protein
MLIGCINCYNDMPLIKDCVESLYDKVDKIICVDGSYDDFPDGSGSSIDGTIEYLNNLDKIDLILANYATEVEKRNLYLTKCIDGDIVINLDADEVLVGNIPTLISDFGIIDFKDGHSKHIQKRATRFFKFRTGMRYENVHYTLYYNGQIVNNLKEVISRNFTSEDIKDFYLIHNWHLRDDLRKHNKQIYYRKLNKKEAGFVK